MFELYFGVYAEKTQDGRFRIFTADSDIAIYVNIDCLFDCVVIAGLLRDIAFNLYSIRKGRCGYNAGL